jgi:hypothetical protein
MEAIRSSETSVLIRATRRHLPEDDNHHSHRRGNLKSYDSVVQQKCNAVLCYGTALKHIFKVYVS